MDEHEAQVDQTLAELATAGAVLGIPIVTREDMPPGTAALASGESIIVIVGLSETP